MLIRLSHLRSNAQLNLMTYAILSQHARCHSSCWNANSEVGRRRADGSSDGKVHSEDVHKDCFVSVYIAVLDHVLYCVSCRSDSMRARSLCRESDDGILGDNWNALCVCQHRCLLCAIQVRRCTCLSQD